MSVDSGFCWLFNDISGLGEIEGSAPQKVKEAAIKDKKYENTTENKIFLKIFMILGDYTEKIRE